jgi:hypothetical protein
MRSSRSTTLAVQIWRATELTEPPKAQPILLPGSLGTEETMKRQWHVRREAVERPDAWSRWDQAYQSILRWNLENERGHEQARAPGANASASGKEEYHEGGGIRTGLDLPAGQARND